MRPILVLALLTALTGCRRSAPPPEPAAAEAAALPAPEPAAAPPAVEPPPAPAAPAETAAPPEPAAAQETPPQAVAEAPSPPEESDEARRLREAEEEDRAIYTWTDAEGAVHFGSIREVPDGARGAHRVDGGGRVMVVPATSIALPLPAQAEAVAPPAPPAEAPARVRGPQPQLDDQGLPIPGTMDDTAHTRAVKQATGVQLDPAALERAHQEELRRLKCRVVDGVTICG